MFNYEYNLEHLCSYTAKLAQPEAIGPVPEGIRVNFNITGGTVKGPKFEGEVLPVGADWSVMRSDGVANINVRTTMKSTDGALIFVEYPGTCDWGEDGYQKMLSGDFPMESTIHATPVFRTAHPSYQWLNRLTCISIGKVDMVNSEVTYDVYVIR